MSKRIQPNFRAGPYRCKNPGCGNRIEKKSGFCSGKCAGVFLRLDYDTAQAKLQLHDL